MIWNARPHNDAAIFAVMAIKSSSTGTFTSSAAIVNINSDVFQAPAGEDTQFDDHLALSSPSKTLRASLLVDTPTKSVSKRAAGKKRAAETDLESRETVRMTRSRTARA